LSAFVIQLTAALANGNLDALANLTSTADTLPYFTGAGAMASASFPAAARALLNLSGTAQADRLPYLTGANGGSLTTLTALARDLLAGTSSLAMRNTLGAQQALNSVGGFELGQQLSGDRVAYIDFHAED